MGLSSRKDLEQKVEQQNQEPDVENARVVEFGGKPHVHIDYKAPGGKLGDIGTIGQDGRVTRTYVKPHNRD